MARYIDVNNAIKAVKDLCDCHNGFSGTYDKACIIDLLQEVPTEDVEPVKYGEWLGAGFDGYADGNPVYDIWACSVCHAEVESEGEPPEFRYCPNCGARMEGEK